VSRAGEGAHLLALVAELEALTFDATSAALEPLVVALPRRQTGLDALAKVDVSSVDTTTRQSARDRLEAVQRRDAETLALLTRRRDEIIENIEDSGRAKEAVRGYRAATTEERTPSRGAF
jgi:hypothetical protein